MIEELMSGYALEDISSIRYPVWAQDKEDGIRCALIESPRTGKRLVASRTFKPIANIHIRDTIHKSTLPLGVDGELVFGNFQQTASAVMSHDTVSDFKYRVFDYFGGGLALPYRKRYAKLEEIVNAMRYPWLELMPNYVCHTAMQLQTIMALTMAAGKEGLMIRDPDSPYKSGKATIKSQSLLKLKPFIDADAQVIGFEELVHKDNPSRKSNTLGAIKCRLPQCSDVRYIYFNIGTGFTELERQTIWDNQIVYLNKWVTFKYQNHGMKNAPRTPVFLRWKLDKEV